MDLSYPEDPLTLLSAIGPTSYFVYSHSATFDPIAPMFAEAESRFLSGFAVEPDKTPLVDEKTESVGAQLFLIESLTRPITASTLEVVDADQPIAWSNAEAFASFHLIVPAGHKVGDVEVLECSIIAQ